MLVGCRLDGAGLAMQAGWQPDEGNRFVCCCCCCWFRRDAPAAGSRSWSPAIWLRLCDSVGDPVARQLMQWPLIAAHVYDQR